MSDNCKTCEFNERRSSGEAPVWDCIHRGQYWDLAHAFNSTLVGWMVLILQRHVEAIDELTESEAEELGCMIRRVSVALKSVTGCLKTYVIQFAEHCEHPHVHFHIIPRMKDQPDARRSTGIMSYLGDPETEWIGEDEMNQIARQIRSALGD